MSTKASAELKIGDKAPSFSMPVTGGGMVSTTSLKSKPYVLYFYPKDNTSGCTKEACDFSEALPKFGKLAVTVIGVSKDSLSSHEKFKAKFDLGFELASDTETEVAEKFGVWIEKSMYGRKYMGIDRSTFLIDDKGIIRALWRKVSVTGHVEDVMKAVKALG